MDLLPRLRVLRSHRDFYLSLWINCAACFWSPSTSFSRLGLTSCLLVVTAAGSSSTTGMFKTEWIWTAAFALPRCNVIRSTLAILLSSTVLISSSSSGNVGGVSFLCSSWRPIRLWSQHPQQNCRTKYLSDFPGETPPLNIAFVRRAWMRLKRTEGFSPEFLFELKMVTNSSSPSSTTPNADSSWVR